MLNTLGMKYILTSQARVNSTKGIFFFAFNLAPTSRSVNWPRCGAESECAFKIYGMHFFAQSLLSMMLSLHVSTLCATSVSSPCPMPLALRTHQSIHRSNLQLVMADDAYHRSTSS